MQRKQMMREMKALIEMIKSEQVAAYLDMNDRTFRRKLENSSFDRLERERMEKIAQLMTLGSETFGSREKFMIWMLSAPETFKGNRPVDLLASQRGIQWVEETLYAIQHGLPE